MCNAYYIIIKIELRQAFFEDFLFSKKVLDIVFFLYFYHSRHISGLLNCYFFIKTNNPQKI